MTASLSRRFVLAGLAAGCAGPALAGMDGSVRPPSRGQAAPPPRPADAAALLREAGLGGSVGWLCANLRTGAIVDAAGADLRLPPASVAKAATAYYALSRLGADHRFLTRLLATGPVAGGRLSGDLVLAGGGDPTLDTDALGDMAARLAARGVREVTGALRPDASALPEVPFIDPDQPDQVAYNPAISGLNLNFNRVHFEWKRGEAGYTVSMEARGARFSPGVGVARMDVVDRALPVYTYAMAGGIDRWTVARGALGREGARWLPVRRPTDYAAETFETLARAEGIALRRGAPAPGADGEVLVQNRSVPLDRIARDMLLHSTNLTAEAIGLAATRETAGLPGSLIGSARAMNLWFNRELGCRSTGFIDHSGLGYGSRVSAADMVRILRAGHETVGLDALMKGVETELPGVTVRAKTGTLNFVSALAGYVFPSGRDPLVFAVFTADMPRRDAIPVAERERPEGARAWAGRARSLQKRLIGRWVALA